MFTPRLPSPESLCRIMALSGNSMPVPSPYTTLKEKVSCVREIKKSKFIAVAAHVPDEVSAHSFLSQVRAPCTLCDV